MSMAGALPDTLQNLWFDCLGCRLITDVGVGSLARGLPAGLQELRIDFANCKDVTRDGMLALKEHLPQGLKSLFITCRGTAVGRDFKHKHELQTYCRSHK